jgi:predicted PurR-regulated permease PerM
MTTPYPRWPLYIIAIASGLIVLRAGQSFFVPVIFSILLFYALLWPVDALEKLRIPRSIGAGIVIVILVAVTNIILYAVWAQLASIAEAIPKAISELVERWNQLKYQGDSTLAKIQGSAEAVQRVINGEQNLPKGKGTALQPTVNPGFFSQYAVSGTITLLEFVGNIGAIYLLTFFLLVDGEHFRRRWVSFSGKALSTKRITVQALNAVDDSIRRYLAMLLITNAILGILTYLSLKILGVADAAGWGVLATLLHVIPYFGTLLVAAGVFITSFQQLGDFKIALVASGSTIAVAFVIGAIVQTWLTARAEKMNASLLFIAIFLFGILWGAAGLLLAVPLVVIIKVVLGSVPSLKSVGELVGDGTRA